MNYLKTSLVVLALAGGSGAAYAQDFTPPPIGDTTNSALEAQNKALVLRLYSDVFPSGDQAAAAQIVSPDAVEHGMTEGKGVDGQLAVFNDLKSRIPNVVATVKHVGADGDFVGVQWHASSTPDDELSGEERIDFYRVANGQIVEAWLASESIAPIANGNTPFGDLYVYPNGAPALTEEQEQANLVFVRDSRSWLPGFFQHGFGGPLGDDRAAAPPGGGAPGGPPGGGAGGAPGGPPGGGAGGPPPGGGAPGGAPGGGGGPPGGFTLRTIAWLSDGDMVWELNDLGSAGFLVDLYRVVDNQIVEHYDIAPLPGGPGPTPPAQ